MVEIINYDNKYAEDISRIIVQNLLEINSKDYSLEFVKKASEEFTPDEIKKNFPKRTNVFISLKDDKVVGTASLDKSWYNNDGEYWILSVFVDISHHNQGIGKMLINKVEQFAKTISAKKLVIDKQTGNIQKLIVQDKNQKNLVYILYNEIKINSLKKEEVLAFRLQNYSIAQY